MQITETDIEIGHIWGQFDEINTILSDMKPHPLNCKLLAEKRLGLRYRKAELTGQYWKLLQDKQRERRK